MTCPRDAWPYPGSRWWKFDFHTHTPVSLDTPHWQDAKGTPDEVTPERWLQRYMDAEIDCVAITDHNTGAWVDQLKDAYARMKAKSGENFRELHLFPGVEISVNGGWHLLAILGKDATTQKIDRLLGAADYQGTPGDSDGVTRKSAAEVISLVGQAGGIAIPAHADCAKGLLEVEPGTKKTRLDGQTISQVLESEKILAMEWCDAATAVPAIFQERRVQWTRVLGSDSHSFQGAKIPGSRYTWVKMSEPTLEGLRLALLDGNGLSIRRSDEFEPGQTPPHFITEINISDAYYMGNGGTSGKPEVLKLTPFYNALIGGRGTGKSTIVHALRLAFRRTEELRLLKTDAEPRRQFERFHRKPKNRDDEGALRENTQIEVTLSREGLEHRLRWRADGQGDAVEVKEPNKSWQGSASQAITSERFPIRLLSQGQIAALAGDDRQALLQIIDEAGGIARRHKDFDETRRTFLAQCARRRELDGRLKERQETERRLADVNRKLEAFSASHHAEVLKAHQKATRQKREVEAFLVQLQDMPNKFVSLAQELTFDDWPPGTFETPVDDDVLKWRETVEAFLQMAREQLLEFTRSLTENASSSQADARLAAWRARTRSASADYESLQATLVDQGVDGPQAFGRLLQEKQHFEMQLKDLDRLRQDRDQLKEDMKAQWQRLLDARRAISQARADFLEAKLQNNKFVRMSVETLGTDPQAIERSLRGNLDVLDERFEADLKAIAQDLIAIDDALGSDKIIERRLERLKATKGRLLNPDPDLGGHFRKYLERRFEKAALKDELRCWFPEDDLRIEYSREGDGRVFTPLNQGASAGQRAAALLAFLLAFGDEPLILDQPEDDLDNHLIYDLIVNQIRQNKLRRQLIIVTHNSNIVVNGDAEMVHAFEFGNGQCYVKVKGALQDQAVRNEVRQIMEGGRDAFERRWARLGREI